MDMPGRSESRLKDVPPIGEGAAALLGLNNAHAEELSFHTPESWERLVEAAFFARAIGDADAFLIAFDQDGDYASPNFL